MSKHSIHRYQKAKLGKLTVWRCILSGCLHYIHNEFVIGQFSLCRCGRKFEMTKDKQRRKTPKCDLCQSRTAMQQKGLVEVRQEQVQERATEQIRDINIDDLLEGLE